MSVLDSLKSTARLRFRHIRQSDVELLDLLNRDPGVMTYLDHNPPSQEEVTAKINLLIALDNSIPPTGTFMAFLHNTHEETFIGWFALTTTNDQPDLELGYRIRRNFWNQGFATEGSKALINHAFQTDDSIERIFAETMFVNKASRAVMVKCGLVLEKTYFPAFEDPLPGTELGEVVYGISREMWERREREDCS